MILFKSTLGLCTELQVRGATVVPIVSYNSRCTWQNLSLGHFIFLIFLPFALCSVWNLESGKCLKTLKHSGAVWVVKMDGTRVVSGCDRGLVKVWCADTGTLIKVSFLGGWFCAKWSRIFCAGLSCLWQKQKRFYKKKNPPKPKPKAVLTEKKCRNIHKQII